MKIKLFFIVLLALGLTSSEVYSQTTVYAKNSDISDNLDLRAVASIFGESASLQDFERRLNDPKYQISNLDLNEDNQVDYLRVIESVENRTHVIIIQSVLDRDIYQDVATIDIERDHNNKVVVQVVGNTYLYGANYIYEPVYNVRPVIYASFWTTNYRPYYSSWNWNYYPSYYYAWTPYPVYRYRKNINVCINVNNHYNYVNTRRSYRAPVIYESRRSYAYETRRPNHSFTQRHSNINNRYELEQKRVTSRATTGRASSSERNANRNYAGNNTRINSNQNVAANRAYSRDNGGKTNRPIKVENEVKTSSRDYSTTNRGNSTRNNVGTVISRDNNTVQNSSDRRENISKSGSGRNENGNFSRDNSNNRTSTERASSTMRIQSPRNYSENRSSASNKPNISRTQNVQRTESARMTQGSGNGHSQRESSSESGNSRRRN